MKACIIISFLLGVWSMEVKISLGSGDFCLIKFFGEREKLLVKANVKQSTYKEELDGKGLLTLIVDDSSGSNLLTVNSFRNVNEIQEIPYSGDFTICFKPIYEDEFTLDYQVNSNSEIDELKNLADKKYFDEIAEDLEVLYNKVTVLDTQAKSLSRKTFEHFVGKQIKVISKLYYCRY